jgi:hypothetical protein
MLPSIEWKVDVQGATDKVFYVFGQGRLREMHENVFRMKNSSERGSTFRHHKVKKEFDVNRDDGYERAKREFAKIANSIA